MIKRAVLLVETRPVSPDREADFNEWYEKVHIPQILDVIPGVTGARRFMIADASAAAPSRRYLAIYEIEAEDPADILRSLGEAMASGTLEMTDAIDTSAPGKVELYEAI